MENVPKSATSCLETITRLRRLLQTEHRTKASILRELRPDLKELHRLGLSWKLLAEELSTHTVEVSAKYLSSFLARDRRSELESSPQKPPPTRPGGLERYRPENLNIRSSSVDKARQRLLASADRRKAEKYVLSPRGES